MAGDPHLLTEAHLRSSLEDLTEFMVETLEENRLLKLRIASLERLLRSEHIALPPIEHEDDNYEDVGC
jgi:hypothetical protein